MDQKTFQTLYKKAKQLATDMHKDQRYGMHPYTKHLEDVVSVLMHFGACPCANDNDRTRNLLIAAWLHDIIEDTPITRENLEQNFGKDIADLVWAVTNEPGKNRAERWNNTWPKIKAHPIAVYLKVADRIANVMSSLKDLYGGDRGMWVMYRREWVLFEDALKPQSGGTYNGMWTFLDGLMNEVTEY